MTSSSSYSLYDIVMGPCNVCVCVCVCIYKRTYVCKWCVQVLRSPKEAFAAAMQSWRERCEKCVCLQGDYVEK